MRAGAAVAPIEAVVATAAARSQVQVPRGGGAVRGARRWRVAVRGAYGYGGYGYRRGYGAAAVGAAAVGAAAAGAYYNRGCGYDAYGNWVCN